MANTSEEMIIESIIKNCDKCGSPNIDWLDIVPGNNPEEVEFERDAICNVCGHNTTVFGVYTGSDLNLSVG